MALNYCPNCGEPVVEGKNYCINCGEQLQNIKTTKKRENIQNGEEVRQNDGAFEREIRQFDNEVNSLIDEIDSYTYSNNGCIKEAVDEIHTNNTRQWTYFPDSGKPQKKNGCLQTILGVFVMILAIIWAINSCSGDPREEVKEQARNNQEQTKENVTSEIANIKMTGKPGDDRFERLAEDKDKYLLFLRVLGNAYDDLTAPDEVYYEWKALSETDAASYSLLWSVFQYRTIVGQLPPDFLNSFAAFWSKDYESDYNDVYKALEQSFIFRYRFDSSKDAWLPYLAEKDTTRDFWDNSMQEYQVVSNSNSSNSDFEWLSAKNYLYAYVKIYLVDEEDTSLFGTIIDTDLSGNAQIYLASTGAVEWFSLYDEPISSSVLKVRSDDPSLPSNNSEEQVYMYDGVEYYDFENHIKKGAIIYLVDNGSIPRR